MKYYIALFAIALLVITSCSQTDTPVNSGSNRNNQTSGLNIKMPNDQQTASEAENLLSVYKIELAKTGNNFKIAGSGDIVVPDDYPTIQAAVNAAAAGGHIRVKAGTYTENVIVNTAGLNIKAVGKVTLNGRFYIYSDNVTLELFKISAGGSTGILVFNADGVQVLNNDVSGGYVGIWLQGSNRCNIKNNFTNSNGWGIALLSSDSNSVKNNTSNMNSNQGIVVYFNNSSMNEVVNNNANLNNLGIWLDQAMYTQVKDNFCNNNTGWGIYLSNASFSLIQNNQALNNTVCDIVNFLGTGNTFSNNNAGCTSGF